MAIAIDQANLGSNTDNATDTTVAFTTTAAVASGGFIVLALGWWNSGTVNLSSVSGGGLTWTIDKQGKYSGANPHVAVVSAQAPSGLASGTTITATFSASADAKTISGMSFTGVATSSPVDGTPVTVDATTAAWSTGSRTLTAGSVLVGASWNEGTISGSTITSPSIEANEIVDGFGYGHTVGYRIESSAGSYAVAGAWNAAQKNITAAVAYKAAAGGGGGQNVNPTGLASSSAFGTPSTTTGGVNVSATGLASSSAFGSVTISTEVSVSVSGLASSSAFGTPTAQPGNVNASVTGLASSSALGSPSITPGGVSTSVTGIASSSAFGDVTTDGGSAQVDATGLASSSAFGTPSTAVGNVDVSVTGLASASTFGSPAPDTDIDVNVTGLGSSSAFGTPTTAVGNTDVQVTGLGSAAQFGGITTSGGDAPTFNPAVHGGKHHR